MFEENLINKVIRSKRRTLSLEIAPDASLIIRAPLRASMEMIHRIVNQKKSWILEKKQKAKERYQSVRNYQFVEGEEFLYLGIPYKLRVISYGKSPFEFTGSEFLIEETALPRVKDIFQQWYTLQAQLLINPRVQVYAQMAGQKYSHITITSAKTRWGSCNSRRALNFSWRLMMTPLEMIDYVVAHEVAHLEELNHSSRFWDKVKSLVPDYKEREQWFRANQQLLRFE